MILCLGTTPTAQRTRIFERVTLDAVNRAVEVHEHASGKSVNVARVAHSLGETVLATGFLGGDRGEFIRRKLHLAGINHNFVTVSPQTRLCTTVVDRSNRTATELVEESAAVEAGDWQRLSQTFSSAVRRAKLCVFSGSLPPGGPAQFYADIVQTAHAAGCAVILDARGEPLRLAMPIPGLTIKLNREELAATLASPLPDDQSLRDGIRRSNPTGGATVVTLGPAGAVSYDGKSFCRISSPCVETISAVGSGDAFAAGFAVGIVRGRPFREACALGAACGAANAMTPLSGHIDPERIPGLVAAVAVTDW